MPGVMVLPKCTLILFVTFSVAAKGFEYDDLYVIAHLELPECELGGCGIRVLHSAGTLPHPLTYNP